MAEIILKDWYGKEQTFDHDKIFVQGTNGELVQFAQGTGEPTLETLEVTENGTYTPSEGVDGFGSVEVNVPTPEITLQDKTITENGTYTADSGFDGLGSVTVDVAGSGSDSTLKFYMKNHNISAALNKRIEIDFGFTPDFILFYPSGTLTHSSKYFLANGISSNFANALGISAYINIVGAGSSSTFARSSGTAIENSASNGMLYNVNSTGFNLGDNYNYPSGVYTIVAIGL